MAYKDLLVHLDDGRGCAGRIEAAIGLAAAHGAHLTGFYPLVEIPLISYIRPQIPPEVRASMYAEAQALADAALARFRAAAEQAGVSHETRTDHALETTLASVVSLRARYADLLVLGQAEPEGPPTGRRLPEDVVLACGRPVLLVPYAGAPDTIGRRVVVGWDASREAARAASDAMPFLKRAEAVRVVVVGPESKKFGRGDQPGADIRTHLGRHGIEVEVARIDAGELSIADALLAHVAEREVDLLVMGAYAHSRVRQLVLGGVTSKVLETVPVPVLMAH